MAHDDADVVGEAANKERQKREPENMRETEPNRRQAKEGNRPEQCAPGLLKWATVRQHQGAKQRAQRQGRFPQDLADRRAARPDCPDAG